MKRQVASIGRFGSFPRYPSGPVKLARRAALCVGHRRNQTKQARICQQSTETLKVKSILLVTQIPLRPSRAKP